MPHSPTHSEGNSSKGSSKSRSTPLRKMFEPLTKSRSLRKYLLNDFSSAVPNVNKEEPRIVPPCLPAHLRGNLKMEQKHGVPYFEFSVAQTEDLFVAKTWKADDALNWVYTFHSVQGRNRSNASQCGMKYSNKDSPLVGQMQVKCYLCSELRGDGAHGGGGGRVLSDSVITEFVLYDIDHARKSVTATEEICYLDSSKVLGSSPLSDIPRRGNVELDDLFSLVKPRLPMTSTVDRIRPDFSSPYPLSPADLHPRLEIAVVVVSFPLEKRESLKYKRGERHSLDSYVAHDERKGMNDDNKVKVNVVAPLGNHSSPNGDRIRGPSPLLDRWRLGGGCECGGWDIACPLIVFSNCRTHCSGENSILEKSQPLKLYVQGGKDNVPALTITVTARGEYIVDFHPQLSILQAFAVAVAILHTSEASSYSNHLAEVAMLC